METDIKIPPNGAALRIFVKPLHETKKSRLQVIAIVKKKKGPHFGLSLPERQELFDAGWIPEIKYQFGEHNSVEITVSPRMSVFKSVPVEERIQTPVRCSIGSVKGKAEVCELPLEHSDSCTKGKGLRVQYEVSYERRAIRINGILLSKPNYDSENEQVFEYIYKNPGRKISLEEIERELNRPIKKRLNDIVRDIGFKGDLRIFFPAISKTAVKFVKTVTKSDFQKSGTREIRVVR